MSVCSTFHGSVFRQFNFTLTLTHFLKWIKETEQQKKKKKKNPMCHMQQSECLALQNECAHFSMSLSGRMQITTLHYRIQEVEDV